jgi:hypothetical protein
MLEHYPSNQDRQAEAGQEDERRGRRKIEGRKEDTGRRTSESLRCEREEKKEMTRRRNAVIVVQCAGGKELRLRICEEREQGRNAADPLLVVVEVPVGKRR